VGLIGAGGYAKGFCCQTSRPLAPSFVQLPRLWCLSARRGAKYGFARFLSDAQSVIDDDEANLIVIATRHDSHAELARLALERGKHVFVEKPLALNDAELDGVLEAAARSEGQLLVVQSPLFAFGYQGERGFYRKAVPISMCLPRQRRPRSAEHWTQDASEGGGRIVGEVCHLST